MKSPGSGLQRMNTNDKKLEKIIRLMQADDSVDAPEDTVKWAKNLFAARSAETKPSLGRRIMAVLQAEIGPGRAAFGERSASATAARQILWEADGIAIDMRIKPAGDAFEIRGQLLGGEFSGTAVRLSGSAGELTDTVSDLGEFAFTGVPTGVYGLTISGPDEIVVEKIEIR